MKNILKTFKLTLLAFLSIAMIMVAQIVPVTALSPFDKACTADSSSTLCKGSSDNLFAAGGIWSKVINLLLILIGTISVLVIIVGGIRYVVSGGDPKAVTDAKNTIMYAVVGLVVAIMAGAIVNFVLANIK